MCVENLTKAQPEKREQMHTAHMQAHTHTHRRRRTNTRCIYAVNVINQVSLKAYGILIKDVELYLTPQKITVQ